MPEFADGTASCDADGCGMHLARDQFHDVTEVAVVDEIADVDEIGTYCPEHCPCCNRTRLTVVPDP